MNYTLRISSYAGLVPGAVHYRGRVEGEHPHSCHGGTTFHGADGPLKGKTTCAEGHELPEQITWDVEAAWTEARYERYAAKHFEGNGPGQYTDEGDLIRDAIQRFLGAYPRQWWEDDYPAPQPGDRLYLGSLALLMDEPDPDGWGHQLAEVPALAVRSTKE